MQTLEKWQTVEETRQLGRVSAINRARGYGFIKAESGESYYFHLSALDNCRFHEIEIGHGVSFCLEDKGHAGGPQASKVNVLSC